MMSLTLWSREEINLFPSSSLSFSCLYRSSFPRWPSYYYPRRSKIPSRFTQHHKSTFLDNRLDIPVRNTPPFPCMSLPYRIQKVVDPFIISHSMFNKNNLPIRLHHLL